MYSYFTLGTRYFSIFYYVIQLYQVLFNYVLYAYTYCCTLYTTTPTIMWSFQRGPPPDRTFTE